TCRTSHRKNNPLPTRRSSDLKKSAQAEQVIHCADELVHPSVFDAKTAQVLGCFTFIKVDKFAFDLSTDHNCFSREMMAGIILDRSEEHTSDSSHVSISYAVFC